MNEKQVMHNPSVAKVQIPKPVLTADARKSLPSEYKHRLGATAAVIASFFLDSSDTITRPHANSRA